MRHDLSSLCGPLALIIALAGCAATSAEQAPPGRPRSARLTFADAWSSAILDMGKFPVFPPSEDMYVGDMFVFSSQPSFDSAESLAGLRTIATPRWGSLPVLPLLEEEYGQRPEWDVGAEAAPDAKSIYRAGRTPARLRTVGLRSMLKVTLQVPDLEPFLPIEVAPLIRGPATPERFGVSVQAGDAEIYSLSVGTLVAQLLEPGEALEDGPERAPFRLKPEYLENLLLAADPINGKVYMVVVTEVLYMQSVEATVRAKEKPAQEPQRGAPRAAEGEEPATPPSLRAGTPEDEDSGVAAMRRAAEMNEFLKESEAALHPGGAIEIVMATEDAITLRRSWPYPVAVAIRGITLEVDAASGKVLRMGPLGVALPQLPRPAPEPEPGSEPEAGAEGA